jgi:Fe-S-cluster containining protein
VSAIDRKENEFFSVCSHCRTRSCCINTRPPLTYKRTKIIEAHLRKQKSPLEELFVQASYVFPREDNEGYCIFNDRKTGKCLVHLVKPETCIAGPITFDINPKTRKIEWHLKKETICSLAGNLYRDEERLKKHLALAKKEILRLIRELDAEALKTILKIEEPETFKIGEDDVEKAVLAKLV